MSETESTADKLKDLGKSVQIFVGDHWLAFASGGALSLGFLASAYAMTRTVRRKAVSRDEDVAAYTKLFGVKKKSLFTTAQGAEEDDGVSTRVENATVVTNLYYDLATDFYEYGWGLSFHFAPRYVGESLEASIKRHEHYLAQKLGVRKGDSVLDLGCGVGGPMMEVARFTGANMLGINNNAYQVTRGRLHVESAGLSGQCAFLKADFRQVPAEDASFHFAYAIESACHVSDKVTLYKEIFRLLRPGGRFATYDWVMTPKFDAANASHLRCKKGVELGNGIADLPESPEVLVRALEEAGFEVVEHFDRSGHVQSDAVPWYEPLTGKMTLSNFRSTKLGSYLTHLMLVPLEFLWLVPKGTVQTHLVLTEAADALVEGAKDEIFTPMYFILAKKPEESQ